MKNRIGVFLFLLAVLFTACEQPLWVGEGADREATKKPGYDPTCGTKKRAFGGKSAGYGVRFREI
jgi:hypothetical protein